MHLSTIGLIGRFCLIALFLPAATTRAAEVLAKLLPKPATPSVGSAPYFFAQHLWHRDSDIREFLPGNRKPDASLPGFRTASVGNSAFISGWTTGFQGDGVEVADGFITKVDAAGGALWTRKMKEIMPANDDTTGRVWKINDIEAVGDRLYVCGEDGPGDASSKLYTSLDGKTKTSGFLASLSLDGVLQDYVLFDVPKGHYIGEDNTRISNTNTDGQARACALSIATVDGVLIITVIGDAQSNAGYNESNSAGLLRIRDRRVQGDNTAINGLTLYNGSHARADYRREATRYGDRDIFVARFTDNLSLAWATTVGFMGDDFASSVASDNTGAVFLGVMTHPNAKDNAFLAGASPVGEFDDGYAEYESSVYRVVVKRNVESQVVNTSDLVVQGNAAAEFGYYDRNENAAGFIWRMDTSANKLTHCFMTSSARAGEDPNRQGRVTGLVYSNGSLYAAGEFRGGMRPRWEKREDTEVGTREKFDLLADGGSSDIWVTRLSPDDLSNFEWRFFRSAKDDYVTELTAGSDGIYLAGFSGGSLNTFSNPNNKDLTIDINKLTLAPAPEPLDPTSSSPHTFWHKLGKNLDKGKHIIPSREIPSQIASRAAGITPVGGNLLITGGWDKGTITLGEAANQKELIRTEYNAFAGFLKQDFTWLEEYAFTIDSAYGRSTPGPERSTVAFGTIVTAQVPAEVFEDKSGIIITDQAGINSRAVVKRICTGYQFSNNALNGTSNSVTFTANTDTTLTFNWRTEYAVEIDSDIANSDGLTSKAAGNPEPAVQKMWVGENTPFSAFIDGEQSHTSLPGVRWRSTGYEAFGSIAGTVGIGAGFKPWEGFQARQQTPLVTVSGPGRIVWKWAKEHSLRVGANSIVAEQEPIATASTTNLLSVTGENAERTWSYDRPTSFTVLLFRTSAGIPDSGYIRFTGTDSPDNFLQHPVESELQPSTIYTLPLPANLKPSRSWKFLATLGINNEAGPIPDFSMIESVALIGAVSRYAGTGEFWFPVGETVTVSSPQTVSSGTSSLALKGYTNGTGSVRPFAGPGVLTKTITLNEPSTITWDYARAIYQENVTIGQAITFNTVTGIDATNANRTKAPSGGSVSSGPAGSGWGDMQAWDDVAKKLYVLRPGKFTVEFENTAAPADATQNVIVEVTATWPTAANYTHIMETPPVPMESADAPDRQFLRVAYTEGNASAVDGLFGASERGRSVLLFSQRAGGVATGNLAMETLSPRVVNTVAWPEVLGQVASPEIGSAITSPVHNAAAVGHNGYVINDMAPVNAAIHARASRQGPIIPVNRFDSDPANPPLPALNSAAVVTNGGFETGSAPIFPGYLSANGNMSISGWSTNNPTRVGLNTAGQAGTQPFLGTNTPAAGNQVAFIQNESDLPYLETSLAGLTAGRRYMATIRTNARPGDTATIRVAINGTQVAAASIASAPVWGTIGCVFTAAATNTLRILNDGPYQKTLLIDDVTVSHYEAPVAVAWYKVEDGLRWPYQSAIYRPQWPASPNRIVIASQLGSEGKKTPLAGSEQPLFEGPGYAEPQVYSQADPKIMGYNANEEHALMASSFLEGTRTAAFALHNDLNVTTAGSTYTSEPYVLVQYVDKTDPGAPEPKMAVYAVIEEDAATLDTRLITDTGAAAYNQRYTFLYQGTAGQKLFPPHPLTTVIGPGEWPQETRAENVDSRIAYFEDKKRNAWIVSGDTDVAEDIRAVFYYPMRAEWWHPTAVAGESVVYAKPATPASRNILYNTIWPADVAVLKAGETLTFSGGEYASDNNAATPRPKGLPQAVAWQSARVEFDSSNPSMNSNFTGTRFYGRPVNALTAREVPLPLSTLPDALKPASGNLTVEGLLWYFKKLPASLQNRIYYNSSSQKLGLRGVLNDRVIGDGDLLATPGAQTILQPNILTDADQATLVALSADTAWTSAAAALGILSRNPKSANLSGSLGVGMEPADVGARYAQQNGPGIAVVTNSDLLDSGTAANLPDNGYLTIAENNDPALGDAPVAIHVIKVVREKYRGSVAVIEPENAFDEKVSLQHSGDFGGDVADLFFEWIYREEDGRDLNPPGVTQPTSGTPLAGDWNVFNAPNGGRGQNVIQLAGASSVLITDNVFFCRYRHANNPTGWSAWAGAANSREPNPASPSAATDAAYVAQLAPGWVKRVTNAVNVFDARINDFRNNNAPATYSSMIQQAGQRWEGPVAFNPQKDSIEQVGIIELYQTVLDRAEDLSIVNAAATTGVGTALLNAANRIAGLYTLLGNEAMADSLDPTVGYSTQGGQFGSLSPTIHAFQNQVGDLLQEELALLRGRGETGARPGYNRLVWNFTNGTGEAAYALNYGISDLTNDGFINDADARRLYPQGHGDAWGHYTMALKGYYDLSVHPNFSWVARSEKFLIDGVVLDVDYLDERTFAKTAAARAQCGTRMVDLTYRQAYTENPNGQWQGYRDVNTDRAWGVVETAQRAGTAAFCDWMLANAMLKEEETDPLKTGIRKVDRQTVGELRLIASEAEAVRSKLAAADAGMNPDGLDPNVVPFDIDPVLTDRTNPNAATHFEQIYNRAVGANQNALQAFNYASEASKLIRQTAASTEQLRQQVIDQDLSYRNQLIEIFGTPYEGQIGSGKAYPEGYNGPDLYLYMYVEKLTNEYNPEIPGNETLLPEFDGTIITTTITPNIRLLGNDTNPWIPTDGSTPVVSPAHGLLKETFNSYFPADFPLPPNQLWNGNNPDGIQLELPVQAKDYAFTAPKEWGKRQSPGEFQAAVQALVQAEYKVRQVVDMYEGTRDDFHVRLRHFELLSGISAEQIDLVYSTNKSKEIWRNTATGAFIAASVLRDTIDIAEDARDAAVEALPKTVGLFDADVAAPVRGAIFTVANIVRGVARLTATGLEGTAYRAEIEMDKLQEQMEAKLLVGDLKKELMEIAADIQQLANDEVDWRQNVIEALEASRAASERVRTVLQKGIALTEQRMVFNQRVASTTSKQRYEDFTFRIMHHEALRKYQSSFDLASRYAYLAGKAYQYELNLPDNHAANAGPLLSGLLRNRTLGQWQGSTPVINQGGIAESMGVLKANYDVLKGQLGFNNPTSEVNSFSVRAELVRVGLGSRVNADWRTKLETWRVPDLWNYQYQNNGVNYGYIYRRYCRPFAPEDAGAQPALVIPFDSTIAAGQNWFGKALAGGDSAFNASNFSTKIRSAGLRLDGFNSTALSQTPQVYLVPVGLDRMFLPDSATLQERSWNVVDQRIPVPLPITGSNLSNPDWRPYTGSTSGFFEEIRKFSSFRAYHDAAGYSAQEMLGNSRLVGRSVWNTQWVLIIPSATLLNDPDNRSAGIDTLIYGAPLSGFTQSTAGTVNRDLLGIRDLRILLQTYSISGN